MLSLSKALERGARDKLGRAPFRRRHPAPFSLQGFILEASWTLFLDPLEAFRCSSIGTAKRRSETISRMAERHWCRPRWIAASRKRYAGRPLLTPTTHRASFWTI